MKRHFYLLFIICFSFLLEPQAAIRYVKPVSSGLADGSSWANASNDLQDMINKSSIGDQIWVAAGTYKPNRRADAISTITPNDRNNAFVLAAGIDIYGGFAGTETNLSQRNWTANPTILSGDIGVEGNVSDNCYHVIVSSSDMNNIGIAHLDGFTITGGNANGNGSITLTHNIVPVYIYQYDGGGMYNFWFSPILTNVIITGNSANNHGGGIYDVRSSLALTNVLICGNIAGNHGGGIYQTARSPVMTNVTISGNKASYGNEMYVYIGSFYSSLKIRNSIIHSNTASARYSLAYYTENNYLVPEYYHSLVGGSGGSNNWNTNFGIDGGNNIDAYPLFESSIAGNYRLTTCSPAINKGYNGYLSTITTDLDGNPRIYNAIVDIGAYEFIGNYTYMSAKLNSKNTSICYKDTVTISLTFGGEPPWQLIYTKDSSISFDTIKNIMDSLFYLKTSPRDTTIYMFTEYSDNNCESPLNDSIQIDVLPFPTLTSPLEDDTLCDGEQTKEIEFSGDATLYEWTASENILGILSDTGDFGEYIVANKGDMPLKSVITVTPKYVEDGKICSGESASFTITVLPEPKIISPLEDDVLCDEEQTKAVVFKEIATNYEWTASGNVSGLPIGTQIGNFGSYTVTNKTAAVLSSAVSVTPKYIMAGKECVGEKQGFNIVVNPTTKIESITAKPSAFMCEGHELTIEVDITGATLAYQWYKDSNVLQGERNKNFVVHAVSQENSGKYYVEVTGFCGAEKSKSVAIDASGANVLVEKWHDVIFVDNSSKRFSTYQWYKDGRILKEETKQFYQEIGGLNGCYSVELRLKEGGKIRSCVHCAYKTSKEAGISVYPNPTTGQLIIEMSDMRYPISDIRVFDIVGKEIPIGQSQIRQSEIVLNISHLASGLYFLKVDSNKMVKFIKE